MLNAGAPRRTTGAPPQTRARQTAYKPGLSVTFVRLASCGGMRRMIAFAAVLLPLAVAAPAAPAVSDGIQPPDCPLYARHGPQEHPLTLPDGTRLFARDPYGGLLARNRLFFSFGVRAADGGRATGVARVTWSLDGALKRTDPTAPFTWVGVSGSSRRIPAGDHRVTVTVSPAGAGAPVSTSFALTATDCQPASSFSSIEEITSPGARPRWGSSLQATSSLESGEGPTLRRVTFTSADVRAGIPASARGRVAGMLRLGAGGAARPSTTTLRVPRRGSTLLDAHGLRLVLHPGVRGFLTLTGAPAGTRDALVTLTGTVGRNLLRARRTGSDRCRYAVDAAIASPSGATVTARGGTVSGLCRFHAHAG